MKEKEKRTSWGKKKGIMARNELKGSGQRKADCRIEERSSAKKNVMPFQKDRVAEEEGVLVEAWTALIL